MSKSKALTLALFSALLSVLFGVWHIYVCFYAALILMLVFDWIWAAKVTRDKRLAARNKRLEAKGTHNVNSSRRHLSLDSR